MKYTVLHPISFAGERRERGSVIEMEEAMAAAYGPEYVVPFVEAAPAAAPNEANTEGAETGSSQEQQPQTTDAAGVGEEAAPAAAPSRRRGARAGR